MKVVGHSGRVMRGEWVAWLQLLTKIAGVQRSNSRAAPANFISLAIESFDSVGGLLRGIGCPNFLEVV